MQGNVAPYVKINKKQGKCRERGSDGWNLEVRRTECEAVQRDAAVAGGDGGVL